jgi:hypothetical protein
LCIQVLVTGHRVCYVQKVSRPALCRRGVASGTRMGESIRCHVNGE